MKEILILTDKFLDSNLIEDFLVDKKINCKFISANNLKNENHPKSTLLCTKLFEDSVDGRSGLLKLSRNIGCTNLIVLKPSEQLYSIKTDLGGALIEISFRNFDQIILEIMYQIISNEKYCFSDKKTHNLIHVAKKVAKTDVTVFIHGPTGTGKEVISNLIHHNSPRSEKPFVAINCAAIPENMLEAMLFGHEKGAFTGASSANKGIFRAADMGTLLLDEISEMPLSLQAKLLRVLQEKKVTPIGGQRDIDVDVRVIATTNRDMISEVQEKKFREDLYYRLNVFPIETSNLSERPDDILPISIALLKRHSSLENLPLISKKAEDILKSYKWPGNVRELENVLQRAIVLCENNVIEEKDIMIDSSMTEKLYSSFDQKSEKQTALKA